MFTGNDNPYRAPAASGKGEYDHSLFWRLVKIVWCFIVAAMLFDAFLFVSSPKFSNSRSEPVSSIIAEFFTDHRLDW